MPQGPTDLLAWLSIGLFVAGVLAERSNRRLGRLLVATAWVTFGLFWAVLVPHFLFVEKSAIEGVASVAAVPASVYTGYLLWHGRNSLFVLSRAIAVMGAIYLPATTIQPLFQFLVEETTRQVAFGINVLGYSPEIGSNEVGIRNTFVFTTGGELYETFIILACTGLGSIAIFAGIIAAVRAPLDRKVGAFLVSVPIIWVLNIVRNVWIAVAFGKQWLQVGVAPVSALFGVAPDEQGLVSFYLADKIIAQSASLVALLCITLLVVRRLPESTALLEDVVYVLTRRELDIQTELGLHTPAATDGGVPDDTVGAAAGSDEPDSDTRE
jgi:archaeosortase A (PGF-CTERM-specific)